MENPIAILKINEDPRAFLDVNGFFKVENHPAGINFYTANWNASDHARARLENINHSFSIEHMLGVTATDEPNSPEEGIVKFSINAGISSADVISHEEARQRFVYILKNIRKVGWQRFLDEGDPRLSGRDMLDFILKDSPASSMDPDYEPTFEEWMKIPSRTTWSFYANHVYLSLDFSRDPTLTDPNKPGAYLITFTVNSENNHYKSYVDPKDRKDWKNQLSSKLAILPKMRKEAEAELRTKGVKIDEFYVDPPKPSFIR
ncbi:hypothetical protein [Duganella sp. Leaf126]|uniref:hypothetical protein n=1 Tax=Duganella sp. Leaf126 TaxID=1736266 RepID=UPI0012E17F1F|nr:hypothetical protein [Duganella sp. Leaf126]